MSKRAIILEHRLRERVALDVTHQEMGQRIETRIRDRVILDMKAQPRPLSVSVREVV